MERANNYFNILRIEIIEQPAQYYARFRYACERRNSKIPGANSTKTNPTYPTIKVSGPYNEGEIIVIYVSCVTSDRPHKPHPYNLVGTECRNGICKKFLDKKTMTMTFTDLQINCVKKYEFDASLELRKQQRLFSSRNDDFTPVYDSNQNFDLNCLRLCFQGFLYRNGDYTRPIPLQPIVSQPIFSSRNDKGFKIVHLNPIKATAGEITEFTLLCTKIDKNDCEVIFFDEPNTWSEKGNIKRFHQQTAIVVEKPIYPILIDEPKKLNIQLHKPSKQKYSDPAYFWCSPNPKEPDSSQSRKQTQLHSTIDGIPYQPTNYTLENIRSIEQCEQGLAAIGNILISTNEISPFTISYFNDVGTNVNPTRTINQSEVVSSCSYNRDTINKDFLISKLNNSTDMTINNQSQPFMQNMYVDDQADVVPSNLSQTSDSTIPSFSSMPNDLELNNSTLSGIYNSDIYGDQLSTDEMMDEAREMLTNDILQRAASKQP